MTNPILASFEAAFNSALDNDPETKTKLLTHAGKIIHLTVTDLNLNCRVIITSSGIELSDNNIETADIHVQGKSLQLLQLIKNYKAGKRDFSMVNIQGDINFAHEMQQIMAGFQFNWEEQLAQHVGDTPAYYIGAGLRNLWGFGQRLRKNIHDNLRDYIHEEARLSPSKEELEDFYEEIEILRDDVDRLDAKLQQLTANFSGGR